MPVRWGLTLAVLWLCLFAASSCAGPPEEPAKVAFWIGTSSGGMLDEQTLRFIADRAGMVVLDAPLDGPAPSYDYPVLVERLHELRPGLPVLFYTWASMRYESARIGASTLEGYSDLGPLLLRDAEGEPIQPPEGPLFGDVAKEGYRDWLVERVQNMLEKTGADGVALDVVARTPTVILPGLCKSDPEYCADYARGIDALLSSLQEKLGSKIVLYNGLWTFDEGLLADQQKLLPYADAAAVEYFGLDPLRERSSFDEDILPFLEIMRVTPQKTLLMFGRGPWHYNDYREDYFWQRYLYGAYLLGAGENTLFKYHSSFQAPAHAGRSGGLDAYADWEADLGEPRGSYQQRGGLYLREFAKGLVLVAPHDGRPQTFRLTDPMFDLEGERLSGTVSVPPGRALLLFSSTPPSPTTAREDFEDSNSPFASWRWSEVRTESGGNRYLHLGRAPEEQEWEHDLLLEPVRSLREKPLLRLRLRTTDPGAKLLVRVEVDDADREYTHTVIEVASDTGVRQETIIASDVPFRAPRGWGGDGAQYEPAGIDLQADGQWHSLTIPAADIFGEEGRYTFRRWEHVRIIGAVDLDDVEVLKEGEPEV